MNKSLISARVFCLVPITVCTIPEAGPLADKKFISTIKKLESLHGHDWVHEALRIKDLSLNSYGVTP
jgi:hypothetical protein